MAARLINGSEIAEELLVSLKQTILNKNITPGLASIFVGDNADSQKYLKIKAKKAAQVGIRFVEKHFPANFNPTLIHESIRELNDNSSINGIIVQLPLPAKYNQEVLLKKMHPFKDVDCMHPKNLGLLISGTPLCLSPVTKAVLTCIKSTGQFDTKCYPTLWEEFEAPIMKEVNVVLLGYGFLVGRPLAVILPLLGATVTIVTRSTKNADQFTKAADIIITGTSQTDILKPHQVKKNVILIDVGNDLDQTRFLDQDLSFTPTPGGIGPLTVAYLLQNTVLSALSILS